MVLSWCFHGGVCAFMVLSWVYSVFSGWWYGTFMVLPRTPMIPPCCFHGAFMVFPWCLHGAFTNSYCASMMFLWPLHGASVVVFVDSLDAFTRTSRTPRVLLRCFYRLQWRFHGAFMVRSLCRIHFHDAFVEFRDESMVPPRCFHGLPYSAQCLHGAFANSPWCCHGLPWVLPWCFHDAAMGVPWSLHRTYMESLGAFMLRSWHFHGTTVSWHFREGPRCLRGAVITPAVLSWCFHSFSLVFVWTPMVLLSLILPGWLLLRLSLCLARHAVVGLALSRLDPVVADYVVGVKC